MKTAHTYEEAINALNTSLVYVASYTRDNGKRYDLTATGEMYIDDCLVGHVETIEDCGKTIGFIVETLQLTHKIMVGEFNKHLTESKINSKSIIIRVVEKSIKDQIKFGSIQIGSIYACALIECESEIMKYGSDNVRWSDADKILSRSLATSVMRRL